MRDITGILLRARSRTGEWSVGQARELLAAIAGAIPQAEVEWDEDAGERWGRVVRGASAVAYVKTDFPLVVIRGRLARECPTLTRAKEIETVVVDDFDDECFSVDAASWGHIFPDRPIGESIDLKRLSVNHLWFATV